MLDCPARMKTFTGGVGSAAQATHERRVSTATINNRRVLILRGLSNLSCRNGVREVFSTHRLKIVISNRSIAWTKCRRQQPIGVQLLQPLAIRHIRLAPRHRLELAGIDQPDLEAPLLEKFLQRNPRDAGRFHRDRPNATLLPPVSQNVQVVREDSKLPHGLRGAILLRKRQ